MASTLHVLCARAKDLWPFDAKLPATCSSMLTLLRVALALHLHVRPPVACTLRILDIRSRPLVLSRLQLALHIVYIFLQSCLCSRKTAGAAASCSNLDSIATMSFALCRRYIAYQIYFTVTIFNLLLRCKFASH